MTKGNNYPFGSTQGGRGTSGVDYRFSFNGQEKTPEIADGHTTAKYWEYDSRIARRWNVDPRPVISISPYVVVENNPIANVDVLGDTTRVRNLSGQLMYTIDDDLPNQDHFTDKVYDVESYSNLNEAAKEVRKYSMFFIGKNTRKDMERIYDYASNTVKREVFFLSYFEPKNKELRLKEIKDIGIAGKAEISFNGADMDAIDEIVSEADMKMQTIYIGWGHVHIRESLEYRIEERPDQFSFKQDWGLGKSLSRPTKPGLNTWGDYQSVVRSFSDLSKPWTYEWKGGNPSILITPWGYSIFTTPSGNKGGYLDGDRKHEIYELENGDRIYKDD